MSGLFSTMHTANSGMRVNQKSIQTVSHNISNINTPGYSRQRTEVETNRPLYMPSLNNSISKGQMGMGVQVTDVTRSRNTFYDFQFRSQSHEYGQISSKYDYYKSIETIIKEPSDTGISANLNKFFEGWEELSKDPNSNSSKNLIVENSKALANLISNSYEAINGLQNDIDKNINSEIQEINDMLDRLVSLEKDIKVVGGTGSTPNDLLDERDRILDDLSFKMDIQDKDVQDTLKKVCEAKKNGATPEETNQMLSDDFKNLAEDGKLSGTLQGHYDMSKKVDEYSGSLKDIAKSFSETINSKFSSFTGEDMFVFDENRSPMISVNQKYLDDPSLIDINQDQARELADLKKEKVTINGKEMTLNDHYNSFAERIGIDSQKVIKDEAHQREIILAIDNSRMSVSGVSLDEEMVSLIQLQHSYGANAKVLSTVSQLLDIVVGLV
ncbi:MAG: flagellar hook-associated protein FlgK [Paraclostridium sp.]